MKNFEFSRVKIMSNGRIAMFAIGFLSFCFVSWGCAQSSNPTVNLTISSAASLKNALETLQPLYQTEHPNIKIAYNFASSGSLQRQIEQGAPVDIFISAATQQMDSLETKGLLKEGTRQDLLGNRIVLIVPRDRNDIQSFQDLISSRIKTIAIGEPESVPAGQYAREILLSLGIFDTIRSKTIYGKDVRQVLNYVATENTDGGIVYQTDARTSNQVEIVAIAAEKFHSPIIYPIAVLQSSNHPEVAKEFIAFLSSPQVQEIFERYSFQAIGQ
ncbi:molybdate ABC transporter substrate-binding protein [Lusitaniella coriacea]|nr:molybdate ABC transporter substrate-binding protein [Lusitaniella coriacea]